VGKNIDFYCDNCVEKIEEISPAEIKLFSKIENISSGLLFSMDYSTGMSYLHNKA